MPEKECVKQTVEREGMGLNGNASINVEGATPIAEWSLPKGKYCQSFHFLFDSRHVRKSSVIWDWSALHICYFSFLYF